MFCCCCFFLQFKQLQRLLLWHWSPFTLYAKFKNWTLFSVASVLEVNKNSIVFRLARHLCSSTPLVPIDFSIEFLNCTFPLTQKFLKGIFWTASARAFEWYKPRKRSYFRSKVITAPTQLGHTIGIMATKKNTSML